MHGSQETILPETNTSVNTSCFQFHSKQPMEPDGDDLFTPTCSSLSRSEPEPEPDIPWPLGKVDVDPDDLRETAYEIFFAACRSSPGFGGRNTLAYFPSPASSSSVGQEISDEWMQMSMGPVPTSRIKKAMGLHMSKQLSQQRMLPRSSSGSGLATSPKASASRPKRALSLAEQMRRQMKVTEQGDARIRKTLMRTFVGQLTGRRVETLMLPLELLRHLKTSEFNDTHGYFLWQRRQLRMIEAGLLEHPAVPLDRSNHSALKLRDIIRSSETKALDTSRDSEAMRDLCNAVVELAWRNPEDNSTDTCHWADGFPLNVHLYIQLLQALFDLQDDTYILDELDELIELMKRTWPTLGIDQAIHHLTFMWVIFQQYVEKGQVENDLLSASLAMLMEVEKDARVSVTEGLYKNTLKSTLGVIQRWAEKRLVDYHGAFEKGSKGCMEKLIPIVLSTRRILDEHGLHDRDEAKEGDGVEEGEEEKEEKVEVVDDEEENEKGAEIYIRSSLRAVFKRILASKDNRSDEGKGGGEDGEDPGNKLIELANETHELAKKEKEYYSGVLKKWHPMAAGVAAVTLHDCYRAELKQYISTITSLTIKAIKTLQTAGKLENILVQMAVEDSVDCDDGGKSIVREMVPFDVDSVITNLVKGWIEERVNRGKECLERAKENETWNPKSKSERYAQSSIKIVKLAKEAIEDHFQILAAGI